MKSAIFKTTVTRNSTDYRFGIGFEIAVAKLNQLCWALNALGLRRGKEKPLALISEEIVCRNPAKPWILNRQLSLVPDGADRLFSISDEKGRLMGGGYCREMTPEQTFEQLLGLGESWGVERFNPESSPSPMKVEETLELWLQESVRASTPLVCHDHVEPLRWRHLNVFNQDRVIVFALPRGWCDDDSKVSCVTPP